jgi:3-methyladenine DNA glycosylase AlkD
MARFGITPANPLGISISRLRSLKREIGLNHALARSLWRSGIHEARILASMIADPARLTEAEMERWTWDFDSWDICDQCCANLFEKTPFAWRKGKEWSRRNEEFVRRAGFSLMARLAVSDKRAADRRFISLLPLIVAGARDERNFVRKSVSWALRQIGKKNSVLHREAVRTASALTRVSDRSSRWVGRDALKELNDPKTKNRLHGR